MNQPKTAVPREVSMRSGVNEKEIEVLNFWKENKIFEKTIEMPASEKARGDFSFFDGPPFATGLPHFGHILAGTIKDAIPRFQTMNGKSVRRKWGWDCHGLPIENLIEKKLNLASKKDIEDYGVGQFNKEAYESVLTYEKEWQDIVPRLGRFVDMNHSYKTMDATYTESIWWAWKSLYEKGLAYEGHKMMHICPRCETTLAQSEVGMNYEDVTDISVTAKFELADDVGTYMLAWTTTPWTLPGNTALAVGKDIDYVKVEVEGDGKYILAKAKLEEVFANKEYKIIEEFKGSELAGKKYKPVFNYFENSELDNKENIWKIWVAPFVTTDTGTGIVHIAPAFGEDDMNLAKANNIPVIKHIKMDGTFVKEVTDFFGMKVKVAGDTQSADIEIIKWLAHNGKLFDKKKIVHSYPLCWRCKTPLLNYATSSWFVDVPNMKEKLLSENKKIGWTPEHIREGRFGKWLEGAREWAVSRSRYWGAPLPVWKCKDCDEIKVIGSFAELAEGRKTKNEYYVMRHGESISNQDRFIDVLGNEENHLTDTGVKQVTEALLKAKEFGVDMIVSSPLLRAKESAKIIADGLGLEIKEEVRLAEFGLNYWDGKKIEDFHREETEIYKDIDAKSRDGESHRDVFNRAMATVYDFEKEFAGKKILFVTHGAPILMMEAGASLKTDSEILDFLSGKEKIKLPVNGELKKLELKVVPRDENGKVNVHRPYVDEFNFDCKCGGKMSRILDVFDCWYESGAMPFASIHYPFENKELFDKNFPADFIAEGMDQTRGWFYSLINLGVGLFGKAPYKHVIVNGLVLAESGQKMSKSEKNYTDPMELVEKFGADAVRHALLSSSVVKGENISFSDDMVDEVYKKIILRLDNVVSLFKMNESEGSKAVSDSENILDKWIVSRLNEVISQATKGYTNYCLDEAVRPVDQFVDDLSVWYVRRSRSRLKGDEGEEEKRLSEGTVKFVLLNFAKIIAPEMPFIAERIYKEAGGEKESVHLEAWPKARDVNDSLNKEMKDVRDVVSLALMKRTESKIAVRQPLQKLFITQDLSDEFKKIIRDEVNVKEVVKGDEVKLDTNITPELVKEGDLRNLMRAIQDARKEKGLSIKDLVSMKISVDENYFGKEFNEQLKSVCKIKEIIWNSVEAKEGDKVSFEICEK